MPYSLSPNLSESSSIFPNLTAYDFVSFYLVRSVCYYIHIINMMKTHKFRFIKNEDYTKNTLIIINIVFCDIALGIIVRKR